VVKPKGKRGRPRKEKVEINSKPTENVVDQEKRKLPTW
jgi:hypothetical protein